MASVPPRLETPGGAVRVSVVLLQLLTNTASSLSPWGSYAEMSHPPPHGQLSLSRGTQAAAVAATDLGASILTPLLPLPARPGILTTLISKERKAERLPATSMVLFRRLRASIHVVLGASSYFCFPSPATCVEGPPPLGIYPLKESRGFGRTLGPSPSLEVVRPL